MNRASTAKCAPEVEPVDATRRVSRPIVLDMPFRPDRTSQREPPRGAVRRPRSPGVKCVIVATIEKERGYSVRLAVVTRDGHDPILGIELRRDGYPLGRSEIPLASLDKLEAAIAACRKAAKR